MRKMYACLRPSIDGALKEMRDHKADLLRVLERPEIPLHNNAMESDIREFVKRKKISGGTRNDAGRRCRDTFASLKKTCRKLAALSANWLGRKRISRSKSAARLAIAAPSVCHFPVDGFIAFALVWPLRSRLNPPR